MPRKKTDNGAGTAEPPPRGKQQYLAGCEPPSVPEIDDIAANFYEAGQMAKRAREREQELGDRLIALMVHHKLWAYRFENHIVTLELKNKIKVARDQGE